LFYDSSMQIQDLRLKVCTSVSDGRSDECLLLYADNAHSNPAVVFIHGFNRLGAWDLLYSAQRLLQSGYSVILPSQPGFGGTSGPSDYCGPNTVSRIHKQLTEMLLQNELLNPLRIGLWGVSRGALVAALLIERAPHLFSCAILQSGAYDFEQDAKWKSQHRPDIFRNIQIEVQRSRTAYQDRSPGRRLQAIFSPILIIHGGQDETTPCWQAENFAAKLQKLHKDVELKIIPGAGHQLVGAEHFAQNILPFLNRTLKAQPVNTGDSDPRAKAA
jgi:dipeptidyl aminopeptidase/acylaminoacyl peptidase